MLQPEKYWANIIHRLDDQNSLTYKCIENWALLGKTYAQPAISIIGMPRPPGVCPKQSPRKPALFFCPVQGCVCKHLSAPGVTFEKISVSRGEAQPFGEFTQLSARVTLYDNSVYGNWLRQKGVAKVSGILEGSDFNVKSICEKLRKGRKRKG